VSDLATLPDTGALARTGSSITFEAVTKTYEGTYTAVEHVDFKVEAGEFFSLLGPSGCGKTTTLRMVAGFETPTSGRVLLGDEDITSTRPAKRPVNLVFQDYALFPHMTVGDNVAFGLKVKGLGKQECSQRVGEALASMRLTQLAGRRPAQLSGGQRQRVALARALVNRPKALLLDEPLGALDLQLRKEMQLELGRLHRSTGTTFLYVTHDQEEALTLSDRIAVMNAGRIEQLADPRTLYERPGTAFVAGFIGTSNILVLKDPRRVGDNHVSTLGDGDRIVAPVSAHDGSLQVTVRPERIYLHPTEDADVPADHSAVRGVVSEVVYCGSTTHVTVDLPTSEQLVVHELSNDSDLKRIGRGSRVRLSWAPDGTHVIGAVPAPESLVS
jgi:spermidine/putrescine transport system ATP-binding protein